MDLLITMFVVLCVGTVKVIKNLKLDRAPILEADGSLNRIGDERPIGNNIMLKRDSESFTYILKELRLRK